MREILKEHFGFNDFKPIQEKAIKEILAKKDILVVLPTGSGKSLIYQLPSLMMDGITVVISPLIALMQDQIAALELNGIKAKMISSNNTAQENAKTISKLQNKKLKFLYIAPERFTDNFISLLQNVEINFFVVDEAHCVSEWGHEFRVDYRKLSHLKVWFKNTPIAAFTATATKMVQDDILQTLKIDKNNLLRAKTTRDNLYITVRKRGSNSKEQIVNFLNKHKNQSGIIYCFTRNETEKLSAFLNKKGFNTKAYHAGLPVNEKNQIFKSFKNDEIDTIVATIAFGMGIDKSNIRYVLHTSMPKTLENYYQEIGRAGRDGLMSYVLLLYSKSDEIAKRAFVEELEDSEYKQNIYKKLHQMYRYASTSQCRHKFIAKYFGDEVDECKSLCDNCLKEDKPTVDITIEAQKFISAVIRTGERFGQNYIIDVLRGSKSKRIVDFSHDKLSVYGIGEEFSKEQWAIVCERLFDMEALDIDSEFGSIKINAKSKQILKKEISVDIAKEELEIKKAPKTQKSSQPKDEIFEKLREKRASLAKEQNVPAYIVFSDKTLEEMARKLPKTKEEFLSIAGVGEAKLKSYGDDFISLCKELSIAKPKTLGKTYLETLSLVKENKTLQEISEIRELKIVTILHHIDKLSQEAFIDKETKESIVKPLKKQFPKEIKEWIEQGLKIEDIKTLRDELSKYTYLFMPS